jgi:acetyl esterase/lipase
VSDRAGGLASLVAAAQAPYFNPTVGGVMVLQLSGMHEADAVRDIEFAEPAQGDPLRMDVYRPPGRAGTPPVVLVGGPPEVESGRTSSQKVGWSQLLAAFGIAAVAFDIRFDHFLERPAAPVEDVGRAIDFVLAHAADLCVDATRMATLGFSLGTAPWHLCAAVASASEAIRCNVVYYGAFDFDDVQIEGNRDELTRCTPLQRMREATGAVAPVYVAKAARDAIPGINESIDRFVEFANASRIDVRLAVHETGRHGFDIFDNDRRSQEIILDTIGYLRRRFGLAPLAESESA